MQFRQAVTADIPQIMKIRMSVKENVLSDPNLVTAHDCEKYINNRGRGWVCIYENLMVGFAIADLQDHNIWALFIDPEYERKGIGRKLHKIMLDWYFEQTTDHVWLSTAPGSRAESFYRKAGWKETGIYGKDEIKFEMTFAAWKVLTLNIE